MGKKRPQSPTLEQKKMISRAGLIPDNWLVFDDGMTSMVLVSHRAGVRRVITKPKAR